MEEVLENGLKKTFEKVKNYISSSEDTVVNAGELEEVTINSENKNDDQGILAWIKDMQNSASAWASRQGAKTTEISRGFNDVTRGARTHITETLKPLYTIYGNAGGFGAPTSLVTYS